MSFLNWFKKPKQPVKTKPKLSGGYQPKSGAPPKELPTTGTSATTAKPNPPPKSKENVPKRPKPKPVVNHDKPDKEFLRTFNRLTYRHRAWDIWRDFITMAACTFSNAMDKTHFDEREVMYMKIIKKYNKDEQVLFPELLAQTVLALEANQEQDFLGKIFMDLDLGNYSGGQFFTPYHVCDLMAKISVGDAKSSVEENGYMTIHDPCCGAGATLIAGIHEARRQLEKDGLNYQKHVLVIGQDIDMVVALMCYIQLSLLGVAGYIKIGNTLTDPMTTWDTLENYWFTPMYFSGVWRTRRLVRKMGELINEKEK